MEDEIILNGDWYIPETDETIPGDIHINKTKKIIWLRLVSLAIKDQLFAPIKVYGTTNIIKGKIDSGGVLLLYDCLIGGQRNELFGRTTVIIKVKAAFWGLDINRKEELKFNKVRIDFGEIINWTGLCYFDWENKSKFRDEKLEWVYKDDVVFQINEETSLTISPHLGSKSTYVTTKNMTISQCIYMYIEYSNAHYWDDIINDIKILNDLLTLGVSKAVYIDEVCYYHDSHKDERLDGYIQEAVVFLGDEKDGRHTPNNLFDNLFVLHDLIEKDCFCLKNWYMKYSTLKPIIELYETMYNFKGISSEMLFLNLVQALETYHARFISDDFKEYVCIVDKFLRETYPMADNEIFSGQPKSIRDIMIAQDDNRSNKIFLKSRLGYLFLARFEIIFDHLLGYKLVDFIQKTLDTRNYFTHYSKDKENMVFSKAELPYVNNIIAIVLQYYILKEIGIDKKIVIKKIQGQRGRIEDLFQSRKKR